MNEKILNQLQDSLRGSPLSSGESLELALQILAWIHVSVSKSIPEELRFNSTLLGDGSRAIEILMQLGQQSGLVGQAFLGSKHLNRLDPTMLQRVLDIASRLSDAGMLKDLNLANAIGSLQSLSEGEHWLPPELVALLVRLGDIHPGASSYAPWDFCGQISELVARTGAQVYLETPWHSTIPALCSLLAEKQFQIQYADPIRSPSAIEGGKPRKFDVAIAFPPMGLRYDFKIVDQDWFCRFPERTISGAVLTARHLLSQANRRVVVAVQNSLLFSGGGELAFRQDVLKSGQIQAVIAMPAGLLSYANAPFSILVMDPAGGHEQINFINADAPEFRESISKAKNCLVNLDALIELFNGNVESANSKFVSVAEVLKNDAQLQVSRYVLPEIKKKLQARLANEITVPLGEVALTIRPMPTTMNEAESIEALEIGAADLPGRGYIRTPGRAVRVERQVSEKNEQQFLLPLDIVLIVKGSVGRVGVVPLDVPPPGPGGWIAGQSATVLRMVSKSKFDPRALAVQLRSALGQELLNGIVSGASIQLIQLKELTRLQILVPTIEEASLAAAALEREAQLQNEIDRLRQEQAEISLDMWSLN